MSPLLRKRDGSVVQAIRNPDGSVVEMPVAEDRPFVGIEPPSGASSPVGSVRRFLSEIGKRGGKARAARHSRDEIAAWGAIRHKTKSGI